MKPNKPKDIPIFDNQFGKRLRAYRKAHNLSRDELAKMLSFSKATLKNYENGNRRRIGMNIFFKIQERLSAESPTAICFIMFGISEQLMSDRVWVGKSNGSATERLYHFYKMTQLSIPKFAEVLGFPFGTIKQHLAGTRGIPACLVNGLRNRFGLESALWVAFGINTESDWSPRLRKLPENYIIVDGDIIKVKSGVKDETVQ